MSASIIHPRVQPTAARWRSRFSKMHGALHALHVSLKNAFTKTVHKWLKRIITPDLSTMEIYLVCNTRSYLKPLSKAQNMELCISY